MSEKTTYSKHQTNNSQKDRLDLFIKNGTILNVYSGELLKANIGIRGERIWYVGPLSNMVDDGTRIIDAEKKVLVPGYVDPHFHPWNIYNPLSFGEEACRLGTTTLVCDNLTFFMLMGLELFEEFMDVFSKMPVKFFWFCRAVPQTPMEQEDDLFSVKNIKKLLKNPNVQALGEITRWQEVVLGNPKIMSLVKATKLLRKRVDGHTAGAKNENLIILSRQGIESCHESISGNEVLERLRLGFYVMLRESSLRQDLSNLLKPITENRILTDRLMLTTDSSTPAFYDQLGINDNVIKIAIKEGIDPVAAYRMATINPAVYFGLDHDIGGIAPGRYGDILVLEDILNPVPETVISKGKIVVENGKLNKPFPQVNWPHFFPESSFVKKTWTADENLFRIPSNNKNVNFPVIKLINTVITSTEWTKFKTKNGFVDLDGNSDLCLVSLINRDGRWVTNGVLKGFGASVEALASSFNTAAQILVIGQKPDAMRAAVNRVLEIKGGIVAFENGRIVYELPLPLGGIMSEQPMRNIAAKDIEFQRFLAVRGYPFHDPLYTLIFLPNDFLPDVRLNYKGIIDIKRNKTLWPRRDLAE
ncbi:MAG TPA: adenine deaminase C-terminal domain-containing protein [Desulfobacteraceae bacterium]|nr:adenine deaminase C-terminal domain-containing protein [Desulfobacteraceae bacterium]HPJ66766.1 adenine deaminase C-terminal domain-containing protein [Desulfobacteraceae bacterium]HPQ26976.1 adenine deaminase C-terminal domain-containing protein [Desulfobacteraceae bacterium]